MLYRFGRFLEKLGISSKKLSTNEKQGQDDFRQEGVMIRTVAKAETPEERPAFVEKFDRLDNDDVSAYCRRLKEEGFTHYLNVRPGRVTVGDISWEWRILIAAVFFKREPPSFDDIKSGSISVDSPVLERRKFYSDMSSVGKGEFCATLDGSELASWVEFFESESGVVREIDHLI